VRRVDVASESYATARASMNRIEPADLVEPQLSRLAEQTNLDSDGFRAAFA
jgi:hypothetical protein